MTTTIKAIEDAIVAALEADAQLAASCQTIVATQGTFDAARKAGQVLKLPALAVLYVGGDDEPRGMWAFEETATFQVTVAARNLRASHVAARGTGTEAGAYELVERVRAVLSGQTLGLDISELVPRRVEAQRIDTDELEAHYIIQFTTRYEVELSADELPDLTTAAVTYQTDDTVVVTDTLTDLEAE